MATATKTTPLAELTALGQSPWMDNISRLILDNGDLKRLIEDDDLRGVTSNPTIFEKAIAHSKDYDEEVKRLVGTGGDADAIYQALTVADIEAALDLFRPTYDRTSGLDGYVSLEVSPLLAMDGEATLTEARKLWKLLDRPNAMIKIPGTPAGVPVIEEALFDGLNVNVTLLFSVEAYEAVAHAYLNAIKRRDEAGLPLDHVASVASFFVSRIDAEVDKRLEAKIKAEADPARKAELESLMGKAAIANAKNAYTLYQKLFEGPEFAPYKAKGARVQRLLWASVGTKNKKYPDTLYIDELIGPETVSTMPPATYDAFKDHGVARVTITEDAPGAIATMAKLNDVGIDFHQVTDQLLQEGVDSFAKSFHDLMGAIRSKRETLLAGKVGQTARLGALAAPVDAALADLKEKGAVKRLWDKDASLWKAEDDHAKIINNSLGWLTVAETVRAHADDLETFSDEIAAAGFKHVVLMGMGGSSLCPEVLRRTSVPVAGHPVLIVLDSTVPATIRRIEAMVDPAKTLFVVASKSGTTTEPSVFYAYFYGVVKALKGDKAGENFVAITDPGTLMEANARKDHFRRIFLNPSDIGGRYSALSFFGMVPAALMGLDVKTLLDRAIAAAKTCGAAVPIDQNPGAKLGAALGALALEGRDKVTLVTPPPLEALGLWIEQLIAESTGKEGKGILPVAGEELGKPADYGKDRVFVEVRTADASASRSDAALEALAAAGNPVIQHTLADVMDLGAEFFRWEVGTALAGQRLGIDPFDQPNVQESKDNTKALLAEFQEKGSLPEMPTLATVEGLTFSTDPGNADKLGKFEPGRAGAVSLLKHHFARVKPGDYVAITQYFDETDHREATVQALRLHVRDALKVATTTGYGPRFLHSTGQLHKGGPDTGVFLQLTADDGADLPIPEQPFGFATLVKAQALGDFQSLASRHRRALRVHLGTDVERGLRALLGLIQEAVGPTRLSVAERGWYGADRGPCHPSGCRTKGS